MRLYMFKEGMHFDSFSIIGMVRFATEPYESPSFSNLDNVCQHLTNYAINKENSNFIFNTDSQKTDVGHKRSLTSVFEQLKNQGRDIDSINLQVIDFYLFNSKIKKIFIRTLIAAQPILAHHYKSCQPENYKNNMCFEILGMDVMIDHKSKVWLLEVNHTPSFSTDTPFDYQLKFNVVKDTITLMNFNESDKQKYMLRQVGFLDLHKSKKDECQKRMLGAKKVLLSSEEKTDLVNKLQLERDEWELQNLGNYEQIIDEATNVDAK